MMIGALANKDMTGHVLANKDRDVTGGLKAGTSGGGRPFGAGVGPVMMGPITTPPASN